MKYLGIVIAIFMPVSALGMTVTSTHDRTLIYKNAVGSFLKITLHRTAPHAGRINGTFTTALASKTCKSVINQPTVVHGFYTGNAFSLTLVYPNCGAAAAMVGNFTHNKKNIRALFIDAHQNNKMKQKIWTPLFIGFDDYQLLRST